MTATGRPRDSRNRAADAGAADAAALCRPARGCWLVCLWGERRGGAFAAQPRAVSLVARRGSGPRRRRRGGGGGCVVAVVPVAVGVAIVRVWSGEEGWQYG